jgi:hypothetical protein
MTRKIPPAIVFGLSSIVSMAALATPAHAEDKKAAQIHIRGSIVNFGETTLQVKTREGEAVDVALADGWTPPGIANAKVTEIKPGDYVGVASIPREGAGEGSSGGILNPTAA